MLKIKQCFQSILIIVTIPILMAMLMVITFIMTPHYHSMGGLNAWKDNTFQNKGEKCINQHKEFNYDFKKSLVENSFQNRAEQCLKKYF